MNLAKQFQRRPLTFLLCASLFYYLSYFNYGIDLDDEGFLLLNASSILLGQWPMADFFSYQPLSYFLLAGCFRLLGDTVFTERLFLIVMLLFNVALVYYCARRVVDWRWAFLPAAFYAVAPGPWYKVFFISHMLLCCGSVLWFLDRPGLLRAGIVGSAVGIALVSRVEAGFIALCLGGLTVCAMPLGRLQRRPDDESLHPLARVAYLVVFGIGAAIPVAAVLEAYAIAGKTEALFSMVQHYYDYSRSVSYVNAYAGIATKFSASKILSRASLEMWVWAVGFTVCAVVAVHGAAAFVRARDTNIRKQSATILAIGVFGLGSLGYTYYYVWNSRMLSSFAIVYVNYFLLLALMSRTVSKKNVQYGRAIAVLGIVAITICVAKFSKVQNYSGSITTRMSEMAIVEHPKLAGLRVYAEQKPAIEQMLVYTRAAAPGDALITMSESTTMGYLAGLPNPTYYRLFTAEFSRPGEQEKAIRAFESLQVRFFVARRSQFISGGGPGSDLASYAPKIRAYLIDNYTIIPLGNSFVLLERKSQKSTRENHNVG
jgi:hypothetical protein